MVIVCPSCATEYTLERGRIGPGGRSVRCSQCRTAWFVYPPAETPDEDSPAIADPAAITPKARARIGRARAERSVANGKTGVQRTSQARSSLPTALIAICIASALGAVAFRTPLVRAVPQAASLFAVLGLPVNLVGLTVDDVSSSVGDEGGRPVLVTEGRVTNPTGRDRPGLPLDLTIQGRAGETLYRWTAPPPAPEIPAGESRRFTVRLASPPAGAMHILVVLGTTPAGDKVASR